MAEQPETLNAKKEDPSWASIAKTLFALYAGLWAVDLVSRALSIGAVRSALWGLVVAAPVALCLAVLVFLAISSNHRLLWRARFDRRPYVLVLGSFSRQLDDEHIDGDIVYEEGARIPVDVMKLSARQRGVEETLSLLEAGAMVRIGGANWLYAKSPSNYLAIVRCSEAIWFEVFRLLARQSNAILLIPGATESVTRELRTVAVDHALLEKTIVVQPPAYEFSESEVDDLDVSMFRPPYWYYKGLPVSAPTSNRSANWRAVGERLQPVLNAMGVQWPDFQPKGRVFALGRPTEAAPVEPGIIQVLVERIAPDRENVAALRSALAGVRALRWRSRLRGHDTLANH